MPLYRYEATDASGRPREGVLDALTQNELVQRLSGNGLRVHRVELDQGLAPAPQTPPASPPVQQRAATAAPAKSGTYIPPRKRTLPLWTKGQSLYFVQLANLLRSGITVTEALETLASRRAGGAAKSASLEMAKATASGTPLSTAMQSYPDLFTPGQVGAVQAGEEGGYLWEACHTISEQTKSTWKLSLIFGPLVLIILATIFTFLIAVAGIGVIRGGLTTINTGEASGPAMSSGAMQTITGPGGIAVGIIALIFFLCLIYGLTTHSRPLRHRLARMLPLVGKRTRGECLSMFCWHMSNLSKAGLSPWRAYTLAAEAVPNMDFARRLRESVKKPGDQARLSQMLYQSGMIPDEYTALIETGELTGTVPQALNEASTITIEDARSAERNLKMRAGCWGLLLTFGGGMIAFLIMYRGYLTSAFEILDPFK